MLLRAAPTSTSPPLGCRSFAVTGPLAPDDNASYVVLVHGSADSLPASFTPFSRSTLCGSLRSIATSFRADSHRHHVAHVRRTKALQGLAASGHPLRVSFRATAQARSPCSCRKCVPFSALICF